MKRILITGGAGFIGSSVALAIKAARPDAEVTVLDNLKRRGSELNLPRLRASGVAFAHGDIRTLQDILAAGPVDLLIEASAEPTVMAGYHSSPDYVVHTNLTGALHCFEAARQWNAGVLFLSTSRIYPMDALNALSLREDATRFVPEDTQSVPGISLEGIAEDFPLAGVRSFYGATKLSAEFMLAEYGEAYGIPWLINRMGVIGGPWQMGKVDQGLAALWVARHVFQKPLSYIGYGGSGKQVRDFLHIDDLTDLLLLQIERLEAWSGQTFNVGGGGACSASLVELTALCADASGITLDISADPETRPADVPWFVTDHAAVTAATGWEPTRTLPVLIGDLTRWVTGHREQLEGILG
mgnify:CR=1 FL=1